MKETVSNRCLNCDRELTEGFHYCGHCGQDVHTHRLNFRHILHELTHAVTHADKNIFYLAWQLLYRPGHVAREYIEGRRKKYFNPFTFLLLVVGIAWLVMFKIQFVDFNARGAGNPLSDFLNKHANIIIFLNVPILAFFNRLLFYRKDINYSEHLVFVCFVSGERSILFTLLIAPLRMLMPDQYTTLLSGYLILWTLYFAFADMQFIRKYNFPAFLKAILVPVLTQILIILLISGLYYFYFRFIRN